MALLLVMEMPAIMAISVTEMVTEIMAGNAVFTCFISLACKGNHGSFVALKCIMTAIMATILRHENKHHGRNMARIMPHMST